MLHHFGVAGPDVVLGIDLGTTNSVVAVADGGQSRVLADQLGNRLVPSVVSFKSDGSILVGEEARERRLLDARNTIYSIKRLIGRPFRSQEVKQAQSRFAFELSESANGGVLVKVRNDTYTLTEISAFVLREISNVASQAMGRRCERAVVTVPANFNELQRSATKAAGRVAGLEIARIINEPTAAALAYGYGKSRPERVAVFDLGGGTFDLTLLELENDVFEVLSTAGDSFLGGDDLDVLIADLMCDESLKQHRWDPRSDPQAYERLRAAAEWAKCQLSNEDIVELDIEELTYGAGGTALDLHFRLSRADFENAIRGTVARAFDVCQQALSEAGMKPAEVDNVVLVGGSTRVPLVQQMVEHYFEKKPRTEIDPDLVVAQGAAIHGYALSGTPRRQKAKPGALGRVALKKMSAKDVARLRKQRSQRQKELPKQPAFAPNTQVEQEPLPEPKAPRPTKPPPPLPGLPSPSNRPPPMPGVVASDGLDLTDAWQSSPPPEPGGFDLDDPIMDASTRIDKVPQELLDKSRPKPSPGLRAPSPPKQEKLIPSPGLRAPAPPKQEKTFDEQLPLPPVPSAPARKRTQIGHPAAAPPPMPPAPPQAPPPPPPAPPQPPPPSAAKPVVQMPERPPPLLMDVTPHSLGVETAGGFCQHLIRRNAPIPTEQSRIFTTASDGQQSVMLKICQGESKSYPDNDPLGVIELLGLRNAPRGAVKIAVTFIIDASGVLDVSAVDVGTGMQQSIRVNLLGGADDQAIAEMQARQQRLMQ